MARKSRSFGVVINEWKLALSGHKGNAADFPFLAADVTAFAALIGRAETENAKQEKLKADLAAQTLVLKGIETTGAKSYASLIRYAKAKYGPNTAKIKEFLSKTEGVSKPKKVTKAN